MPTATGVCCGSFFARFSFGIDQKMDALQSQEAAARTTLVAQEGEGWEGVLNYYRQVAREHNAMVQARFKPMFDALLKQASQAPGA